MEYDHLTWEQITPRMKNKSRQVRDFLKENGLNFEDGWDVTITASCDMTASSYDIMSSPYDMAVSSQKLIAVGSLAGNVIKHIACKGEYEGRGITAKMVSLLVSHAALSGRHHLFLFTKPENIQKFQGLGFYPVAFSGQEAVLMDNRFDGAEKYLAGLGNFQPSGLNGCIVMNANPFTRGHLHLVEYAASRCDFLHVFVVMEDKSQFPAADRIRLVREGTSHIANIAIHEGKDYLISSATFPTYFLKESCDIARIHAKLDIDLFCRRIAPYFSIKKRFAGEEPLCEVTAVYNEEMGSLLPQNGIEFCKIPRIVSEDGHVVSASRVRALLEQGQMEMIREIVPQSTYEYLIKYKEKQDDRRLLFNNF